MNKTVQTKFNKIRIENMLHTEAHPLWFTVFAFPGLVTKNSNFPPSLCRLYVTWKVIFWKTDCKNYIRKVCQEWQRKESRIAVLDPFSNYLTHEMNEYDSPKNILSKIVRWNTIWVPFFSIRTLSCDTGTSQSEISRVFFVPPSIDLNAPT
jgi:hypothetical protein